MQRMLLLGSVQADDRINWPHTPKRCLHFWKCFQRSCLKAVSVPAFVIEGLWGSTATSALVGQIWWNHLESLNQWSKCTRRPWACHRAVLNLTTLAAAGRNCFRTRSRVTRVIFEGGMSDLNLIVTITTENGGARDIDAVLVLASSSWRKNLNWSWRSWIRFFWSCQPFPKVFLFFAHVVGAQGREDQISSEARGRADKFWHNLLF